MRTTIPRFLRQADPTSAIDECLSLAFGAVLTERVPDRFRVLLDALNQKGPHLDHDDPQSA